MDLLDATRLLQDVEAIDGDGLYRTVDTPAAGPWVLWFPGLLQDHARLGWCDYTADQLEAIAIWMRAHRDPG